MDLQVGNFTSTEFPPQSFDVITFWDSLASIPDQVNTVRRAAALLAPGGLLFVSVPDTSSVAARILGRHWPLMIPPINVAFHTRQSANHLARASGFQVLRFTHQGKWVDAGFLLLKLRSALGFGGVRRPIGRQFAVYVQAWDIATIVMTKT
jgi:SAM-dependent methyltransferase